MSLPFTSVVSLHTDPYGCGVANFSRQLAKRLGVPLAGLFWSEHLGSFPLFSLKLSEIQMPMAWTMARRPYGVFWHDGGDDALSKAADVVYYADPSLGPNGLWCPPLIAPAPPKPVKLFTFGMAGRTQLQHFERAKQLLDQAGLPFHLRVSTGLHEGTSLSTAINGFTELKDRLWPEHVTILGILSDEAVAEEIRDCDYVLAFFEKGVRANNSTVQSALAAGKKVVTNHDALTPGFLRACTRDITTAAYWESVIPFYYSWDKLIERMTEIYAATEHRHAHR